MKRTDRARKLGVSVDALPDGRGRHGSHVRSAKHPRWNSDRRVDEHGYVWIRVGVTHPLGDKDGWVQEHVLVAVTALGRPLRDNERVHHRNEHKDDNRWENLEVTTPVEHGKLHYAGMVIDPATGRFVGKARGAE